MTATDPPMVFPLLLFVFCICDDGAVVAVESISVYFSAMSSSDAQMLVVLLESEGVTFVGFAFPKLFTCLCVERVDSSTRRNEI